MRVCTVYRELGIERDLGQRLVASRVKSVRQYQQQVLELQVWLTSSCSFCDVRELLCRRRFLHWRPVW